MGDRLTPTGCLSILHLDLNEIDRGVNRSVPRDRLPCRDLLLGLLWNCRRVRSLFSPGAPAVRTKHVMTRTNCLAPSPVGDGEALV